MSTGQMWQTVSTSLDDTLVLAAKIGRSLKGGEVIELVGDLGSGKTAFVRGLADGMGSKDKVSSPSFTLTNEYKAGNLTLYHYDFYRLNESGILADELAEVLKDPQAVIAIEWAEIVEDALPAERLTIHMKAAGEHSRKFIVNYPEKLKYLIP